MSSPTPTLTHEPPYPNPTYAWYVVVLLLLSYIVSWLDRQILSFLIGPIKASFELSDTQIGLLLGPAFAIFYITLGIPLGMSVKFPALPVGCMFASRAFSG